MFVGKGFEVGVVLKVLVMLGGYGYDVGFEGVGVYFEVYLIVVFVGCVV